MSIAAIQDEILGLPTADRVRLIDALWNSISTPEEQVREAAWAKESERRIDAHDAGKLTAREATDVFADLKRETRK